MAGVLLFAQPVNEELHAACEATGESVTSLLESALKHYSTVAAGTVIEVDVFGHPIEVFVLSTTPEGPACSLWSEFTSRVSLDLVKPWTLSGGGDTTATAAYAEDFGTAAVGSGKAPSEVGKAPTVPLSPAKPVFPSILHASSYDPSAELSRVKVR